jgi:hypothetical protein
MMARIGVMRALNRGQVRECREASKKHHSGKRKLKRDRRDVDHILVPEK